MNPTSKSPPLPPHPVYEEEAEPVPTPNAQSQPEADTFIRSFIPTSDLDITQAQRHPYEELPLSLCIPQISVSADFDSAFARGYNPALESVGITQETFLNFIDGLNLAITTSPPLRVVDVSGMIIGFVPHEWAIIAAIVTRVVAQTGIHILSKSLTDRYLRAANLELFQPRGLSVRLCTTPAMLALLTNSTDSEPSTDSSKTKQTLNKVGRGIGTFLLKYPYIPFGNDLVRAMADKAPKIFATGVEGDPINKPVLMRRLALTEGLALPLHTEDLPPPSKPKGVMDMVNSWGVKLDGYIEGRAEKGIEKKRRALKRLEEEEARRAASRMTTQRPPMVSPSTSAGAIQLQRLASQAASMTDYREVEREMRRARRILRDERREAERRMKSLKREERDIKKQDKKLRREKKKIEESLAGADLLEHWAREKCLWLVIMSSERDAVIQGINVAEEPANEEYIDAATWQVEMELEREELEDELANCSEPEETNEAQERQ